MNKKSSNVNIDDLPDDSEVEIDSYELNVLNNILKIKSKSPETYERLKYVLSATIVFMLLSLPFTDRILELAIPMATQSWLILLGIKSAVFFAVYFCLFYINK